MYQYYRTNSLSHHGIKGQKWGVRRFQNEDGSVTSEGAQRYYSEYDDNCHREDDPKNKPNAISKKPGKLTAATSKSYQEKYNMTKEEADAEAKKTVDTVKKVAIGVGVAAAVGIGAYAATRYGRGFMDETIKSGKTLQTLSAFGDRMNAGEAFYTAFRDSDKKKYIGGFGKIDNITGEGKLKITSKVKEGMKIAGYNSGKKEFDNLMKTNSEFKELVNKRRTADNWKDSLWKNAYEEFNGRGLLNNNPNTEGYEDYKKMQKIFYDSLKSKGYSGVKDVNDTLRSGFNTKAAIVFDRSKMGTQEITKLTKQEIQKGESYFRNRLIAEQSLEELMKPAVLAPGASYVSMIAATSYGSKKDAELKQKYGSRKKK